MTQNITTQNVYQSLLEQLERLAPLVPWDEVHACIQRKPNGELHFTFYAPAEPKFGFESIYGGGQTPELAAESFMNDSSFLRRDPEQCRQQKLEKLRKEMEALERATFTLPPYRPGFYLTAGASATVTECEEVA